jgi:hypothetical protein
MKPDKILMSFSCREGCQGDCAESIKPWVFQLQYYTCAHAPLTEEVLAKDMKLSKAIMEYEFREFAGIENKNIRLKKIASEEVII